MPKIRLSLISFIAILLLTTFGVHFWSMLQCYNVNEKFINKPKFRLIVIVLSGIENIERRDTIRKTWLSDKTNEVKHFFPIGLIKINPDIKQILEAENQKHNDLLFLPHLYDSYGTISKKVLQSFVYIYENYDFDYVLKADDDSFVLIDDILKELKRWQDKGSKKELYWGYFNGKARVKKSGPWKEIDWFLCDYYLPYALGGGYILSYNLVKFIADNANYLKLQNSEDVSVGLWLSPIANIDRKHDVRFDTEYSSRGCSNQYLITHKQTAEDMKVIHEFYSRTGNLCAQEVNNVLGYEYNWTVPPSQCCHRQQGIP